MISRLVTTFCVISRTTREYQHFLEEYAVLLEKRFGAKNEMGKGARRVEAYAGSENDGHAEAKAHHVGFSATKDRGGAKSKMGEVPGAEEGGVE